MLPLVRVTGGRAASFSVSRRRQFQLLYVFPRETGQGFFGLCLGSLTPVFAVAANTIWGLSAAWLLRMTGRA
jgi:hypothetical protein